MQFIAVSGDESVDSILFCLSMGNINCDAINFYRVLFAITFQRLVVNWE